MAQEYHSIPHGEAAQASHDDSGHELGKEPYLRLLANPTHFNTIDFVACMQVLHSPHPLQLSHRSLGTTY